MNCTEAKNISLVSILEKMGATITKKTDHDIWYLSPFRNEKSASFKVNITKNIYYDHGEGKGGNTLDFIMHYYKCNIRDALQILSQNYFSFHQQLISNYASEKENKTKISRISELKNSALLQYISSRKLNLNIVKHYCVEVTFSNNSVSYFGIGFANNSGGYEIRNKYFKGCIGKKDITFINNQKNKIIVFEGWTDFLSLLTLYPSCENKFDFMILNSTALISKVKDLKKHYLKIYLCFDNDISGNSATLYFKNTYPEISKDIRFIFKNVKDLNEYLINV